MVTTHTAGPWNTRGGSEEIWIMGDTGMLASVPYRVCDDGTVEYPHAAKADANARLIAAAPDMLANLRRDLVFANAVVRFLEVSGDVDDVIYTHALQRAVALKSAIAKAEGR